LYSRKPLNAPRSVSALSALIENAHAALSAVSISVRYFFCIRISCIFVAPAFHSEPHPPHPFIQPPSRRPIRLAFTTDCWACNGPGYEGYGGWRSGWAADGNGDGRWVVACPASKWVAPPTLVISTHHSQFAVPQILASWACVCVCAYCISLR